MKENKAEKYVDRTIFGIEEEDGRRYIHFYGYGYFVGDDENGKDYRFLEYTFFYAPIEDVLSYDGEFNRFEGDHAEDVKTYITDCTENELVKICEHYDDGKMPAEIKEGEIASAPVGVYIIKY